MSEPTPALCELLPWDTEFFGCRIARVCGDTLKPEQSAQVEEWCRGSRIRCLYFLSRTDDPATIQAAEQQGFGLMDIRVTFEQSVMNSRDAIPPALPADASIRPTQPDDLPALQAMAQAGHTDTRFLVIGVFRANARKTSTPPGSHWSRKAAHKKYWLRLRQ